MLLPQPKRATLLSLLVLLLWAVWQSLTRTFFGLILTCGLCPILDHLTCLVLIKLELVQDWFQRMLLNNFGVVFIGWGVLISINTILTGQTFFPVRCGMRYFRT